MMRKARSRKGQEIVTTKTILLTLAVITLLILIISMSVKLFGGKESIFHLIGRLFS
jgi:hypothetical protein